MDIKKLDEEKLREACSYGDLEIINSLINQGVNVNAQNSTNGWSSLHWACKRGHTEVVKYLLAEGADSNTKNLKNETPAQLVTKEEILTLLASPPSPHFCSVDVSRLRESSEASELNQFSSPHYAEHQNDVNPFSALGEGPVTIGVGSYLPETLPEKCLQVEHSFVQTSPLHFGKDAQTSTDEEKLKKEITLKIRVADTNDPDFIEVDFSTAELSYSYVLLTCSKELAVNPQHIERVRKLPNTRLRNDRDIQRLQNFEELEFVVKGISSKVSSTAAPSFQGIPKNNYKSITNFKNQTILY